MHTKKKAQKKWSERVRLLRERLSYTQQQAAQAFGCSLSTWSHWEQGFSEPRGLYAERLADAEKRRALIRRRA